MIKFFKWLFLCVALLFNTAYAQSTPKMYTLEKGEHTIHLFGSVHAGRADFYPLPDYVMNNFDRADAVAFEIDMTDALSMSLGFASKQMKSMLPDGKMLRDYMSEADIKQIETLMGKPINLKFKPAEYILDLATKIIEQSSLSINYGIDTTLLQHAMKKKKRIIGLETFASQIAIFYDMPVEKQAEMLSIGLKDWHKEAPLLEKMATFWANGDEKLLDLSLAEMQREDTDGEFIEKILYARNKTMAETLVKKQALGINTIFCTIGAMHIYGERSVTDYLQQSGYELVEEFPKN